MVDNSTAGSGPFEEQRRVYELLSQETRHLILQFVLGHPSHLLSLDELEYMIPKSKAAIGDQIDNLIEANVLELYVHEPSEGKRDLPSKFYGPTEDGVEILKEYNYLRGLPLARAIYDNTQKTEKVKRHEDAPRPKLPSKVQKAVSTEEGKRSPLKSIIEKEKKNAWSIEGQIELIEFLSNSDIDPDHEGVTKSHLSEKIGDKSTSTIGTLLNHLIDIDLVEKVEPSGPEVYMISERINEIVNGGDVEKEIDRNLDGLISHIDAQLRVVDREKFESSTRSAIADGSGRSIRSILAKEFDISPELVVQYLQKNNTLQTLNIAIEAIEESEWATKGDQYGKIKFVRPPNRYRLTQKAIEISKK